MKIKMNIVLAFFLLALSVGSNAQIKWTFDGYGPDNNKDEADGITIDDRGNTYIAGGFLNTVNFGGTSLTSKGLRDIYVAKISPKGKTRWIQVVATKNDENIFDLTRDGLGHLIASGYQQVRDSKGRLNYAAIIIKFKEKTGERIWTKTMRATLGAGGNEVVTDSKGNIYSTIISQGDLNLDGKIISSGGMKDAHVVKLTPLGRVLWNVSTSAQGPERIRAIAIGYDDSRILVGYEYRGIINLKGKEIIGTSRKAKQGAYALLNNSGKIIAFEGVLQSNNSNVRATGGFSNGLYVHGTFQGTAKINGKTINSNGGSRDSFVMKIDNNGVEKWIKILGNNKTEDGGEMAVDKLGNLYLTGDHQGPNYSMSAPYGRKTIIFSHNPQERTGYYVKLSPAGRLLDSFSLVPQSFKNTLDIIEVNRGNLSIGTRFIGELKVDGEVFKAGNNKDKDFVILGF